MSLLEARDLAVTPPGSRVAVVEGFAATIESGQWWGITGPNGGGKTSLLLGLAGLWPTRGEICFQGRPLVPDHPRGDLAVILQDPSTQLLEPTVREEIAFGLRNQGLDPGAIDGRIRKWSSALGLEADLDRDPTRLSAGRQQLVLIAAALAGEPKLLLADEPTAHLDLEARRRVLDLVRERIAGGMSAVWVTQRTEELALAHRSLEIGHSSEAAAAAAAAPPSGPELLCARIAPAATTDAAGPRVHLDSPFELEIPRRGITGLLGRNGIGKSVLLGAIAGHSPIDQVQVEWAEPPEPPPIVALQYPELQIFEESPADEVSYAARSRGMDRQSALELAFQHLHELQMDRAALEGRRTWALSTGEKRLLEVVAAIVSPAALYALDEPTAGLDPFRKVALGRLLVGLAESKPVLIATQDDFWLRSLGSRVIDLGRVTAEPPH